MGYAQTYADAIMARGRVPMEPVNFVPDWSDGPRKTKHYPGAATVPLPADDGGVPEGATVARGLFGGGTAADPAPGRFDLAALSGLLRDSYGLTGRRLGVQANTDLNALPHYPLANWSRGTASGGGLYPVAVYWASGPGGPGLPGLHYYSARHHGMRRLLTGDVTGEIRAALGPDAPGSADTDQYLVLGIKYWQNAFKYNSFSFHAVSMDLGALLGTWRLWARARGLEIEPALWFDEARLQRLLGVEPEAEGVFAVVPLTWAGEPPATAGRPGRAPVAPPAPPAPVAVRRTDAERSRRVLTFEALSAMQRATAAGAADRPAPGALAPAAAHPPARRQGAARELPDAAPLTMTVRRALRSRRSSFGRFAAHRGLSAAQLTAALAAAHAGAELGGDSGTAGGGAHLATLYAFVNHVDGVEPGAYAYDPGRRALRLVSAGAPGPFLQQNYFLSNYNLEQAGVVLVPTVRTHAVLEAVGDRGYRLVNATVGAIAQATYTAAAALGIGCGVALGFDNLSYREELDLEGTDEAPLLIMLLGHERPAPADFRYEIA
ncbi:nitroreductase family protein [Streptomyces sp. NPDC059853]|uniref:nitroreductase family protein n=1 Tax=Streptomyces sp. NPDC059853 TaxID=3346973 RepID=UPI00364B6D58